jgi:hypothetical protein
MSDSPPHACSAGLLGAQQRWLFERITLRAPDGAPDADVDGAWALEAERWVRGGRVPAFERIEVYRQGYFARLVECLVDDYPAVERALGPSDFRALCLEFIHAYPPASASLNLYGAPFASFCATRLIPFARCVSDLARLEWAVVEAIHADTDVVLDPAALAALQEADWYRARLVPSPALRVLATTYPVHRYYRAFLEGEEPALPGPEASVVAVCRRGDDVCPVGVAAPFATLLDNLVQGLPLAHALEAVSSSEMATGPSGAADLQRTFSEWVARGFFSALR